MFAERARRATEVIERQLQLLEDILKNAPDSRHFSSGFIGAESLQAFKEWEDETAQLLRLHIDRQAAQRFLDSGPGSVPIGGGRPLIQTYYDFYGSHLKALRDRIQRSPETVFPQASDMPMQPASPSTSRRVFLIYGHDRQSLLIMKDRLLTRWRLEPVIIGDTVAGRSRHLMEILEQEGASCAYAIALLTHDDIVQTDGAAYVQARPNVLLELGWFCGHLGRSKVLILAHKDTRLPSDLLGIYRVDFQSSPDEKLRDIEAELAKAGLIPNPEHTSPT